MIGTVLAAKLALCALAGLAAVLALRWRRVFTAGRTAFLAGALAALLGSRLALFAAVYLVAGYGLESDLSLYYDWTRTVMAGGLPYRDVPPAYGPLFHYTLAVPLWVWGSFKSLILFAVLQEAAALPVWLAIARRLVPEAEARAATVLYVCSPLCLLNVAVAGQNQVSLSLWLGVALLLLCAGRDAASGFVLGASTVVVKFLGALFAPALLLFSPRPARWVLGAAVLPALALAGLVAAGIDPLATLRFHGGDESSGNLPYLLTAFGPDYRAPEVRAACQAAGLLALAALLLWAWWRLDRGDRRNAVWLSAALLLTLLLVSRKAYTSYLVVVFFPLCLATAGGRRRGAVTLFALLTLTATLEPSLWFRWMRLQDLRVLRHSPADTGVPGVMAWTFLAVELTLLACYGAYLCRTFQLMTVRTGRPGRPDPPAPADRPAILNRGRAWPPCQSPSSS
jgi:hypothetical protein